MSNEEMILIQNMFDNTINGLRAEITNSISGLRSELKNHMGVLVEKLGTDIKVLAEGHELLNNKFDRFEVKVNQIENKVDNVDIRLCNVESQLKDLKADMDVAKNYVISVDTKLNEHEVILKRVK